MYGKAWIYETVQLAAGSRRVRAHLAPYLGGLEGQRVLDIGAGTGLYTATIGRAERYVGLDTDVRRLELLSRRHPNAETIVADARRLPFGDDAFDAVLCIFVAHHLDHLGFNAMLEEASRVSKGLILLDPLKSDRFQGRLLWAIDRGAYARTEPEILSAIRTQFEVMTTERFSIRHEYVLCVARRREPRADQFFQGT